MSIRSRLAEEDSYHHIPSQDEWDIRTETSYVHICSNETIGGLQFKQFPKLEVPLVADMSSDILSRELDIENLEQFTRALKRILVQLVWQ